MLIVIAFPSLKKAKSVLNVIRSKQLNPIRRPGAIKSFSLIGFPPLQIENGNKKLNIKLFYKNKFYKKLKKKRRINY